MSLVSVIIPAYNCQQTIDEALSSVYGQSYGTPNLEVIVVNDGSTDATPSILERLRDQYGFHLEHTPNRGASAAREFGRQLANGKYIQYLDSDDLLAPDKIEKQVALLQAANGDVAYGAYERFKEEPSGDLARLGKILPERTTDPLELDTFRHFWFPPAALLFSQKIVAKIGPWPVNLPIIQDARYLQEAAMLGGKFVFTPGVVANYRVSGDSLSNREGEFKFYKDVYHNALEIKDKWEVQFTEERKDAIIESLRNCSDVFIRHDRFLFEACLAQILAIRPQYVPSRPAIVALLSRLLGYKKAVETLHFAKQLLRR